MIHPVPPYVVRRVMEVSLPEVAKYNCGDGSPRLGVFKGFSRISDLASNLPESPRSLDESIRRW